MSICRVTASICALLLVPVTVSAQDPVIPPVPPEPLTVFVVDARGSMASLKQVPTVANDLAVEITELPSRGFGVMLGAHVYPIRMKSVAIGVGAEWLRVRGSNTVEAEDEEAEDGPTLNTRWDHVSPQVSLNFGTRDGWSYLTVGLGRSSLTVERADLPQEDADTRVRTLNYGGGARWFMKEHLAFTFDVRFYTIDGQEATAGRIATPKMRLRVLSAGISIR
jgi:hypothetical protein